MIQGEKAIEQAVRDLQVSLITTLSMHKDTSLDPRRVAMFQQGQSQILNLSGAVDLANRQSVPAEEISMRVGQTIGSNPGSAASTSVTAVPAATAPSAPSDSGGSGGGTQSPSTANPSSTPEDGGLVQGLIKAIPFSGFITKPLDEIRSQRDKNARYQSIEGGPNSSGFAERAHEAAYNLTTMGMFSQQESSDLFYGATALGYNADKGNAVGAGYGRQDILDYAYHKKGSAGQSVEESLAQIEGFVKTPTANLQQFSDALQQVGDAAGAAGVNAKMARDMFMETYGNATTAGFGMGSTSYTQNVTGAVTSYGTAFASNVDTSGMTDESLLRMQSAMQGTTYRQTILSEMKGGNAAIMGQKAGMEKLLGIFNPDVIKWAKDQIAANPEMDDTQKATLGRQILAKSKMDPEQVKLTAEAFTGMTFNGYEAVMTAIVEALMGNGIGSLQNQKESNRVSDYQSLGTVAGHTEGAAGVAGGSVSRGGGGQYIPETTSETGTAYNDYVTAGGGDAARVGDFEQVLQRLGGENQDSQEIKVNGKTMLLKDALQDSSAMNKIAQGKGHMVGGEYDGSTVGEMISSTAEDQTTADTSSADTNVSITLSDEAKRWFEANPSAADAADSAGDPH